jgi:hypothetical protein
VANAIKVFYHLKTLEQKLDTTLTALNAKISQTTKNVLSEDVQREGTLPHQAWVWFWPEWLVEATDD